MSLPKKNRQAAVIYPTLLTTDKRGNDVKSADMNAPIPVRATFSPQSKASTYHMFIDTLPDGVDIWSRVGWNDGLYNVTAPPAYHNGPRHTRHWVIELAQTS